MKFIAALLFCASLFGQAVAPSVRFKIDAEYTEAARKAKIQGLVALEFTIGLDGYAKDIQVVRSLDTGLDANAIQALKQWIFWPAKLDGKPIEKRFILDVSFKLLHR